jgi:nuclear protein NHN1
LLVLQLDDCEEGEIKSEDDDTSSPDEDALDEIEHPQQHVVYEYDERPVCRFFQRGNCHFGLNCRNLHPGVNEMPPMPHYNRGPPASGHHHGWGGGGPPMGPPSYGGPPAREYSPLPPVKEKSPVKKAATPPTESAWERGLRHAKKVCQFSHTFMKLAIVVFFYSILICKNKLIKNILFLKLLHKVLVTYL